MTLRPSILFGVILCLAACKKAGEITVTVRNESGESVGDVTLQWESHVVQVGALAPGEARTVRVAPQAESGPMLELSLPGGERVQRRWDVLYDEGATATVTATIRPGGEVVFDDPRAGPP